jgi:large subunit ribosomal protein L25
VENLITAQVRLKYGKEASRKLRYKGEIPAILYGPLQEAIPLIVSKRNIEKIITNKTAKKILEMEVQHPDGIKKCRVMFKDIQKNAISDEIIHIDFYDIKKNQKIQVAIPIIYEGEAIGVKEQGGAMQFLARNINIQCFPTDIPENVKIDISDLKIGDTRTIQDLKLDQSLKIIDDPFRVIVSVVTIKGLKTTESEQPTEEKIIADEGKGSEKKE